MNYRDAVRKLMDTARNFTEQGNEAAAQQYAEKAASLATKHSVEDALNEAFDDQPAKIVLKRVTMGSPYPKHRISLISAIASHQSCKVLKNGRNVAEIFGDERDVERVMFIYRLVSLHMLDAVGKARPELPEFADEKHSYFKKDGLTPAETKSFRVSWVLGYISGINARMAEAFTTTVAEQKATKPGAALVLSDRRALADKLVAETYNKISRGTRSKINHADGYFAGKAASTTANIGQSSVDSNRRELTA